MVRETTVDSQQTLRRTEAIDYALEELQRQLDAALASADQDQEREEERRRTATGDYHLRAGFDGGLRFNYGSYTDNTIWNTPGIRPGVSGKLRSYSVFFGRVW